MNRFRFNLGVRQVVIATATFMMLAAQTTCAHTALADPAPVASPTPTVALALDRTKYFAGETVLASAADLGTNHKLSVRSTDGATSSGQSSAGRIWSIDTSKLSPGQYQLLLDGSAKRCSDRDREPHSPVAGSALG